MWYVEAKYFSGNPVTERYEGLTQEQSKEIHKKLWNEQKEGSLPYEVRSGIIK